MPAYQHKQLTKHFNLYEFTVSVTAAHLGIDNTPNCEVLENLKTLASNLENVRTILRGCPIIITSGYRCPQLNRATPGASQKSHHMQGWAADIVCPGYGSPIAVCRKIVEHLHGVSALQFDQLIYECDAWAHISFAPTKRGMVFTRHSDGEERVGIHEGWL